MRTNYFLQNINPQIGQAQIAKTSILSQNIENALKQKNILISNLTLSQKRQIKNVKLDVFYRTGKLKQYRIKVQKSKADLTKKNNVIQILPTNNLNLNVNNLNLQIDRKKLLKSLKSYKFFSTKLFNKRINLFGDFLKVLTLFKDKKASVWLFCYILSTIFKSLQKKKHGLYTSFINQIFKDIIGETNSNIQGIKFIIAGRLKGKPRASLAKITVGKISLTSNSSNIQATQAHCYTIYGCFGLKLWINYK